MGVGLLGGEMQEEAGGEGRVAVGVRAGNVDRKGVVVADVLGEDLAALAVEHDDANHPLETDEEIVLAALVVMQPADNAFARA